MKSTTQADRLTDIVIEEVGGTKRETDYIISASGIDFTCTHIHHDHEFAFGFSGEDNWLSTIAAAKQIGVKARDFWSVVQPQLELAILEHRST